MVLHCWAVVILLLAVVLANIAAIFMIRMVGKNLDK